MKNILKLLLLLLASAALVRAEDLPVGPDTLLVNPTRAPAWQELFGRLAARKTRQSRFEESRYFPFRKTPVVLKGEIRIAPSRGLSLRYLEPEHRVLIVDSQGLLMRDEDGTERAAPSEGRAQAITAALVSVLSFDLPTLEKAFDVHGRREGAAWTLAFVPRAPALADLIGVLAVSGRDGRLDRIQLVKTATQRIDIRVSDAHEDVIFPADVLQRFFR